MFRTTLSLRERLLLKIKTNEKTGCWDWVGAKNPYGYGAIMVDGRLKQAHRISYEVHCTEIPDGMLVCHRCDNRACINPEHLFLGTIADNMADKVTKRRHPHGERAYQAKLTESDVMAIRAANGLLHRELAAIYGVSRQQIGEIRAGKGSWKYLIEHTQHPGSV